MSYLYSIIQWKTQITTPSEQFKKQRKIVKTKDKSIPPLTHIYIQGDPKKTEHIKMLINPT
jgi:hypothetical protein